jgi:hypothetical protein
MPDKDLSRRGFIVNAIAARLRVNDKPGRVSTSTPMWQSTFVARRKLVGLTPERRLDSFAKGS